MKRLRTRALSWLLTIAMVFAMLPAPVASAVANLSVSITKLDPKTGEYEVLVTGGTAQAPTGAYVLALVPDIKTTSSGPTVSGLINNGISNTTQTNALMQAQLNKISLPSSLYVNIGAASTKFDNNGELKFTGSIPAGGLENIKKLLPDGYYPASGGKVEAADITAIPYTVILITTADTAAMAHDGGASLEPAPEAELTADSLIVFRTSDGTTPKITITNIGKANADITWGANFMTPMAGIESSWVEYSPRTGTTSIGANNATNNELTLGLNWDETALGSLLGGYVNFDIPYMTAGKTEKKHLTFTVQLVPDGMGTALAGGLNFEVTEGSTATQSKTVAITNADNHSAIIYDAVNGGGSSSWTTGTEGIDVTGLPDSGTLDMLTTAPAIEVTGQPSWSAGDVITDTLTIPYADNVVANDAGIWGMLFVPVTVNVVAATGPLLTAAPAMASWTTATNNATAQTITLTENNGEDAKITSFQWQSVADGGTSQFTQTGLSTNQTINASGTADFTIVPNTTTLTAGTQYDDTLIITYDNGKTVSVIASVDVPDMHFKHTGSLASVQEGSASNKLSDVVTNVKFSYSTSNSYDSTNDITANTSDYEFFFAGTTGATSGTSIPTTQALTVSVHNDKYLYAKHTSGQIIELGTMSVTAAAATTGTVEITLKKDNGVYTDQTVKLDDPTTGTTLTGTAQGVYTSAATVTPGDHDVYVGSTKAGTVAVAAGNTTAATYDFFTLKVTAANSGTVVAPAGGTVVALAGSSVTINITEPTDYTFKAWEITPTNAVSLATLDGTVTMPTTMTTNDGVTMNVTFTPNVKSVVIGGNTGGTGNAAISDNLTATAKDATNTTITDNVTYQWYVAGSAVATATNSTYKVLATDANKTITVKVTGDGTKYTDNTVESAGVTVAAAGKVEVTIEKNDAAWADATVALYKDGTAVANGGLNHGGSGKYTSTNAVAFGTYDIYVTYGADAGTPQKAGEIKVDDALVTATALDFYDFTLTAGSNGSIATTATANGTYKSGDTLTCAATGATGYAFDKWTEGTAATGADVASAPTTITQKTELFANFKAAPITYTGGGALDAGTYGTAYSQSVAGTVSGGNSATIKYRVKNGSTLPVGLRLNGSDIVGKPEAANASEQKFTIEAYTDAGGLAELEWNVPSVAKFVPTLTIKMKDASATYYAGTATNEAAEINTFSAPKLESAGTATVAGTWGTYTATDYATIFGTNEITYTPATLASGDNSVTGTTGTYIGDFGNDLGEATSAAIIIHGAAAYDVTVTVTENGGAYAAMNGKTVELKQGTDVKASGTLASSTVTMTSVPSSATAYSIFVNNVDTGETVTVSTADASVNLEYFTFKLAVDSHGAKDANVTPDGTYIKDTPLVTTVTGATGYVFDKWTAGVGGTNIATAPSTLTAATDLYANFKARAIIYVGKTITLTAGTAVSNQTLGGATTTPAGGAFAYTTTDTMPAGLTLNADGSISGTPTVVNANGTEISVTATDRVTNVPATATFTIKVNPAAFTASIAPTGAQAWGTALTVSTNPAGAATGASYQWYKGSVADANKIGTNSASYTPVIGDAGSTIIVVVSGVGIYATGTAQANTAVINKSPAAPTVTPTDCTTLGGSEGVLTVTSPAAGAVYEYKLKTGGAWADMTNGVKNDLPAGTYEVRVKETTGYNASPATEATINAGTAYTGNVPVRVDNVLTDLNKVTKVEFVGKDGTTKVAATDANGDGTYTTAAGALDTGKDPYTVHVTTNWNGAAQDITTTAQVSGTDGNVTAATTVKLYTVKIGAVDATDVNSYTDTIVDNATNPKVVDGDLVLTDTTVTFKLNTGYDANDYKTVWSNTNAPTSGAVTYDAPKTAVSATVSYKRYTVSGAVGGGATGITISGTTADGKAIAVGDITGSSSGATAPYTYTFTGVPAGTYTVGYTLDSDTTFVKANSFGVTAADAATFDVTAGAEATEQTDKFKLDTKTAVYGIKLSGINSSSANNESITDDWADVKFGYSAPSQTVTITNVSDYELKNVKVVETTDADSAFTLADGASSSGITGSTGITIGKDGTATFVVTMPTGKDVKNPAYTATYTVTANKADGTTAALGAGVTYTAKQLVEPAKLTAAKVAVTAPVANGTNKLADATIETTTPNFTQVTTWSSGNVGDAVAPATVYTVTVELTPNTNYIFDTAANVSDFVINEEYEGIVDGKGAVDCTIAANKVTLTYTFTPTAPGALTVTAKGTDWDKGEVEITPAMTGDVKHYFVVSTSDSLSLTGDAIANAGTTAVEDQVGAGSGNTTTVGNLPTGNTAYYVYAAARVETANGVTGEWTTANGTFTTWYEVKIKIDGDSRSNAATANGTTATATGVSIGVEQGKAIALIATPTTGWAFDEWALTNANGGSFTAGSATAATATYTTHATNEASLEITANFVKAYTVAYDLNGGTGTAPTDDTYTAKESVTLDTGTSYTRTGYTFKGWALTNNASTALTGPAVSIADMLTAQTGVDAGGTLTLYAVWEANELTVTTVTTTGTYGTQNDSFGTVGVADGTGVYTFTATAVNGISIDATTGVVSGKPQIVGAITMSVTVADTNSKKEKTVDVTITAGVAEVTIVPTYTSGETNFAGNSADKAHLGGTVTGPFWDAAANAGAGDWTTATVTGGTWDFKGSTAPTLTAGTNSYDVTYTAPAAGTYSGLYGNKDGTVSIAATAKTYELQVKTGAAYAATGALTFTGQDYGTETVAKTFDLKNTGNQPATALSYTITKMVNNVATESTDFVVENDPITGKTPLAGDEITGISVKPAANLAVGTYSATLTILFGSGATGATTTVSLTYTVKAKSISTVAVTDVTPPAKGNKPDADAADSSAGHYTTSAVTWAPVNDPFAPGTVYTATVTVTPDTNYVFADDATYTFNGKTPTSVEDGTTGGTKVLTYQFPATGLNTVTVTADGVNQNSGKITKLETTSAVNVDFYYVVTTSATAPTATQIIAGQDDTGAAVAAGMKKTIANVAPSYTTVQNINGLTAGETYYVHATALPTGATDDTLAGAPAKDDLTTYVSVTVQVATGGGGSVTPNTVTYVAVDGTVALTATPASGSYKFVSWAVDAAENGAISSENVDGDGKATATLTAKKNVVVTATFKGVPVLSVTGANSGGNEVPGDYDSSTTKVLDGTVGNIGAANMTGKLGHKVVNKGDTFDAGTTNNNFTVEFGSDNALDMTNTTTIVVKPTSGLAAGTTYEATVWVYEIGNADTKPVSTDVKLVVVAADQPVLRPASKDWNLASGATNNDWAIDVIEKGYTSVTSIALNSADIGNSNYSYAHTAGATAVEGTGVLTIPSTYLATLASGKQVGDTVEFIVTMQWHDTGSGTTTTTKTITMTYVDTTPTLTGVSISPNSDLGSGETLTATVTTTSGTPTGNQVTYAWYRAIGDVANPTGGDTSLTGNGNTYETTADDIGKKIYVVATGDGTNYTGEQTSALTEAVKATVTVVLDPATGGSLTAPATATVKVAKGVAMNIEVSESTGYKFTGWTVDNATNGTFADATLLSTGFTPESNATITANYDQLPALTGTPVHDYGPGATSNKDNPTVTYKLNGNTLDTIKVTKNGTDIAVPPTNGYTVSGDTVTFIGSWLATNVGKVDPAIAANGSATYTVTFTTTGKAYTNTVNLTLKNTMNKLTSVSFGAAAQVAVELTAAVEPNGATATYQWYISDTAGNTSGTPINGATTDKYTPAVAQVGKYLYVVATGTGDYQGSVVKSDAVLVEAAGKPTLAASIAANATTPMTVADVTFTPGKAGTYYYVVLPAIAAAPNAQQVKGGKDAAGNAVALSGNATATTAGTEQTFTAGSLTKATKYTVYLVLEADGTLSDVVDLDHTTWFDGTVTIQLDGQASHAAVNSVTLDNSGTITKNTGTAGLWTTGALDPAKTYAISAGATDAETSVNVSLSLGDADKTLDYYTLTLTAGTGGTVKIDSGTAGATATGVFLKGSTPVATAAVTGDYTFSKWTDNNDSDKQVSTTNPYTLTVNATTSLTANFTENTYAVTGKTDGHVKTVTLTKQGDTTKTYTFTFGETDSEETRSVNIPNGTYTITVVTSDDRMMDWTKSTPNVSTGTIVVSGAALPSAFNMVTKESTSVLTVVDDGGGQVAASSNTRTVNATFNAVTAKTYTVTLKNDGTENLTGITLAKPLTMINGVTVNTTGVDTAFNLDVGETETFTVALAATAKVPGGSIEFKFTADDNATIATYTFKLEVEKETIASVVVETQEVKTGDTIIKTIDGTKNKVTAEGLDTDKSTIVWQEKDADGNWVTTTDNTFQQGKEYRPVVKVESDDNHKLVVDTNYTINDDAHGASNTTIEADANGDKTTFTGAPTKAKVTTINVIDVVAPVKNATPSTTATSKEPTLYTVVPDSVTWTPDPTENSNKFKPGTQYTVTVKVYPASGVTMDSTVNGFINGQAVIGTVATGPDGDGNYTLTYAWTTGTDNPDPGPGPGPSIKKLTVKYDIDKTMGTTKDKTSEKVEEGATPANVPAITVKDNYVFLGWTLDPKADDVELLNPEDKVITEDTTFYAVFSNGYSHERYIKGYDTGIFAPADDISRSQVAAIIARACLENFNENNEYGNGGYSDVADDHWARSAIAFCTQAGVFVGVGEGMFEPDRPITRQEFSLVFARMAGLLNAAEMPFTDADTTADWAMDGVYTAFAKGWLDGYTDGTFKPWNNIARSEAVKIVNRYLNRGTDKDGLVKVYDELKQWPDVDESYWAYYDIMEASNDHTYHYADGKKPPENWIEASIKKTHWGD